MLVATSERDCRVACFLPGGEISRPEFDPEIVRREMQVIASELHCTAVRITGGDPGRLGIAAERATAAGLQVWFSPFPCELTTGQLAPLFSSPRPPPRPGSASWAR
jgi:hypothetical protein